MPADSALSRSSMLRMNSNSGNAWPETNSTLIFCRIARTSASCTLSAVVSSGPTS